MTENDGRDLRAGSIVEQCDVRGKWTPYMVVEITEDFLFAENVYARIQVPLTRPECMANIRQAGRRTADFDIAITAGGE